MNTDQLIAALAADDRRDPPRLKARLSAGVLVSGMMLMLFWHIRPDLAQAVTRPLVMAKFLLPLTLAALVAALWPRPGHAPALWPAGLVLLPALALFAATLPTQAPWPAIAGHSLWVCLLSIPLLSVPPALALFAALRRSVVTRPDRAGLAAGLLAGALAALVYALHCDEDAPAFYTVWYGLGIAISGLAGRLAGPRWLGV
ncbi:NrsF family protein [Paracoccus jiaweipingae]|uniref:NrsF family protein n=1 Tax=unclassified Paracoccus (in: a-proteobacteria) TaxID=2688777 RepID=UPI0037B277D5